MAHPPPLTSTTLTSQNGVVTSFHITSPLNTDHRIFISLDTPNLLVLDSQGKNEKCVDVTGGMIWSIASWEDEWFAVGSTSAELSVWNLKTLTKSHTLTGHTSTVRAIKVLSSTTLVSSSRDTTIRIWNISSNVPTCTAILEGHTATIRSLSVLGNHLVSGAYENDARIWDLDSHECVHVLKGHTEKIYAVASVDRIAVTGSMDCTARVWDLESGELLATLAGQNLITQIIVLPGYIVIADNQGILQGWARETYTKVYEVKAHEGSILSMKCDAVGQKVVTGSADGSVKLWDVETGLMVKKLASSESVWAVGWIDEKVVAVFRWVGDVNVETWEVPYSDLSA